ncbi:MAG: M56 family metallopeptidase [Niabella sp.]|nr:M56 family metallopeptidase [Niabella sp.]
MILYFLKVIACSGLLYAFYFFLLQKEKMLVFNRFYLLGAVAVSFLIPLILFRITIEAIEVPAEVSVPLGTVAPVVAKPLFFIDWLPGAAYTIVLLISLVLFLRLAYRVWRLKQKIGKQEYRPFYEARIVLSAHDRLPHSFLNYIFLNSEQFEQGEIDTAVLEHELAHVRQKHSWDILFIELVQALCWFNPLIWLYKRSVQLNHEFLADQAVVKRTGNTQSYQRLLLKNVYVNNFIPLASSFYFFTTKKRLLMLQRNQSKFAVLKALLLIPLLGALIGIFSEKVYSQKEVKQFSPPKIVKDLTENDILEYKTIMSRDYNKASKGYKMDNDDYSRAKYLYGHMTSEDARTVVNFNRAKIFVLPTVVRDVREHSGATAEEMEEYKKVESSSRVAGKQGGYQVTDWAAVQQAADLYSNKMTKEQRASVPKMPPPPPPAPGRGQSAPVPPPPPPPPTGGADMKGEPLPADVEGLKITAPGHKVYITVKYKNGSIIKEDITGSKAQAFEKKYGIKIPSPQPPPLKDENTRMTPPRIVKDTVIKK